MGSYENVIGVGSINENNKLSSFSNRGTYVDIVAPGENIYSTVPGGYGLDNGTSYSAPIVSAVIAMMRAVSFNKCTVDSVTWNLTSTATDRGITGYDIEYGYGSVNAYSAVLKTLNDCKYPSYQYYVEQFIFDPRFYADEYPDLKQAFGYNKQALYNHWVTYGRYEGRCSSILYDPKVYLENNPDLISAFGNDYGAAFNHFVNYGCNEFRMTSYVFNPRYYLNRYSDLAKMPSIDLYHHFAWSGLFEGRQGISSFDPVSFANTYTRNGKYILHPIVSTGMWYYSFRYVLIWGWHSS